MLARCALLTLAVALWLLVLGAARADMPPATLATLSAALTLLLAPLLAPATTTGPRGVVQLLAWSGLVVVAAAVFPLLRGQMPGLPWFGLLGLMALAVHAAVALASHLAPAHAGAAGPALSCALAAAGALPLWAGPLAELATPRWPAALDSVVGASPLVQLAVAAGNDLVRNDWFYAHSTLSGLNFDYPQPGLAALAYAIVGGLLLTLLARVSRPPESTLENP